MSGVSSANLARFYDNTAMKLALEPNEFIIHGLETAVDRGTDGTAINTAAASWVTAGWLAQADADAIAALVTARDTPPEEPGGEGGEGGESEGESGGESEGEGV